MTNAYSRQDFFISFKTFVVSWNVPNILLYNSHGNFMREQLNRAYEKLTNIEHLFGFTHIYNGLNTISFLGFILRATCMHAYYVTLSGCIPNMAWTMYYDVTSFNVVQEKITLLDVKVPESRINCHFSFLNGRWPILFLSLIFRYWQRLYSGRFWRISLGQIFLFIILYNKLFFNVFGGNRILCNLSHYRLILFHILWSCIKLEPEEMLKILVSQVPFLDLN